MDADDGAFWMSWQDFVHNFDELYVCRFYDQLTFPCQGKLEGRWDSGTAGGCCNHPTVQRNVQLAISCIEDDPQQGDIELVIELIQADSRGSGRELPIVILELYDNDGQPVTQLKRGRLLANKGNNTLAVHIQVTITKQQAQRTLHTPLTLLPCTYQPDTLTTYTVRWFASSTVHVQRYGGSGQQTADEIGDNSQQADAVPKGTQVVQPSSQQPVVGSSHVSAAMDSTTPAQSQTRPHDEDGASAHRSSFTIAASQPSSPSTRHPDIIMPRLPLRREKQRKVKSNTQSRKPMTERKMTGCKVVVSLPAQANEFEL